MRYIKSRKIIAVYQKDLPLYLLHELSVEEKRGAILTLKEAFSLREADKGAYMCHILYNLASNISFPSFVLTDKLQKIYIKIIKTIDSSECALMAVTLLLAKDHIYSYKDSLGRTKESNRINKKLQLDITHLLILMLKEQLGEL